MDKRVRTADEQFVIAHWSMWGAEGAPVVKRGSRWYIDGIRGLGAFPTSFRTKRAALGQ